MRGEGFIVIFPLYQNFYKILISYLEIFQNFWRRKILVPLLCRSGFLKNCFVHHKASGVT
ncbi:hypothetical protein J2S07_000767 [Robertmurraya andreesenii]|uniref:Uncharacterized protein n=1 Tax=Anoxybacillus andreesenii TaxID=1325932 RepID=A0ABT9V0J1_9BACL|nr:hypothetical protein [Robertmurraya andreesenii]